MEKKKEVIGFIQETKELRAAAKLDEGQETMPQSLAKFTHLIRSPEDWSVWEQQFIESTDRFGFLSFDLEQNVGPNQHPRVAIVSAPSGHVFVFPLVEYALAAGKPVAQMSELLPTSVVVRLRRLLVPNVGVKSDAAMSDIDLDRPYELRNVVQGLKEVGFYKDVTQRTGLAFACWQELGFHLKPLAWSEHQLRKAVAAKNVKTWNEFHFRWSYTGLPRKRLGSVLYSWSDQFYEDPYRWLYVVLDGLVPILIVRRAVEHCEEALRAPVQEWASRALQYFGESRYLLDSFGESDLPAEEAGQSPAWAELRLQRGAAQSEAGGSGLPELAPLDAQLQVATSYGTRRIQELMELSRTFPPLADMVKKIAESYGTESEAQVPHKKTSPSPEEVRDLQTRRLPDLLEEDDCWVGKKKNTNEDNVVKHPPRSKWGERKKGLIKLRVSDRLMAETSYESRAHYVRCGYCGGSGHAQFVDGLTNCTRQQEAERKRAEKGTEEMLCAYPWCTARTQHRTAVCKTLHHLCSSCKRRGHLPTFCPGSEDYAAAECLRQVFEAFADKGALTRLRRISPASREAVKDSLRKKAFVWVDASLGFLRTPLNCPRELLSYSHLESLSVEGGEALIESQLDEPPFYLAQCLRAARRESQPDWSFGDLSWRGRDKESREKIALLQAEVQEEEKKRIEDEKKKVEKRTVEMDRSEGKKKKKSSPPP